jgi:quercetin dioxygenase-like cupin family protein
MITMRIAAGILTTAVAAMIAGCGASAAEPQDDTAALHPSETLAPLFEQAMPNVPGKNFTSAIVTFPPGARAVPHRHGDAFVYAYVLEGAVSSQLEGEPAHLYHQGENWSEQPGAHHLATENTSSTEPAKLLVVFVANTGEQLKVDDPHN